MSVAVPCDVTMMSPPEGVPIRLAPRLRIATGFFDRFRGLIGCKGFGKGEGLLLAPCSSIHTFGMRFPIDVVFLDAAGTALALYHAVPPCRTTRWVRGAKTALELPAGVLAGSGLRVGQRVEIPPLPEEPLSERLGRLASNAVLAAVWFYLAARMVPELMRGDAALSAYMLFAVNTMIAFLFLVRRPEKRVTHSARDRLVTLACILMSFSLKPSAETVLLRPFAGSVLQVAALAAVLAAYFSLGRSFGLIPADRGVKLGGLYALVRHPLYAGEMFFYGAFVLENFTGANLAFLLGIITTLHLRAVAEEHLLAEDASYRNYCARVRARYVPYLV